VRLYPTTGETGTCGPLDDVDHVLAVRSHPVIGADRGGVERVPYVVPGDPALTEHSLPVRDVAGRDRFAIVKGKDPPCGSHHTGISRALEDHLVRRSRVTVLNRFQGNGKAGILGDQVLAQ